MQSEVLTPETGLVKLYTKPFDLVIPLPDVDNTDSSRKALLSNNPNELYSITIVECRNITEHEREVSGAKFPVLLLSSCACNTKWCAWSEI